MRIREFFLDIAFALVIMPVVALGIVGAKVYNWSLRVYEWGQRWYT